MITLIIICFVFICYRKALHCLIEHNICDKTIHIDLANISSSDQIPEQTEHFDEYVATNIDNTVHTNVDVNACLTNNITSVMITRHLKYPVYLYEMDTGKELAFPWLYPSGVNGFK